MAKEEGRNVGVVEVAGVRGGGRKVFVGSLKLGLLKGETGRECVGGCGRVRGCFKGAREAGLAVIREAERQGVWLVASRDTGCVVIIREAWYVVAIRKAGCVVALRDARCVVATRERGHRAWYGVTSPLLKEVNFTTSHLTAARPNKTPQNKIETKRPRDKAPFPVDRLSRSRVCGSQNKTENKSMTKRHLQHPVDWLSPVRGIRIAKQD
jgi:hypothetical protein